MNPDTFNYKIKSYDAERRLLDVEFDDGAWARVPFVHFMPTSGDELDQVVAQFAPKKEQVLLLTADDYFVRSMVGEERVAARASFLPPASPPVPTEVPPPTEAVSSIEAIEEAWVEAVVLRVLREKSLIPEAP